MPDRDNPPRQPHCCQRSSRSSVDSGLPLAKINQALEDLENGLQWHDPIDMSQVTAYVGIDFDNTIVCYDRLFRRLAVERGLIDAGVPAAKARCAILARAGMKTLTRREDCLYPRVLRGRDLRVIDFLQLAS